MLYFILLQRVSPSCNLHLGFLLFSHICNQSFKAVELKWIFRSTIDTQKKNNPFFCIQKYFALALRHGITWSLHTTPTHEGYKRIQKSWNGAAEEEKQPWDPNLQAFFPMINYSAMRNLIWIIKSTQSTKVKYIRKYLQAWTLIWPEEAAEKLCPYFPLSSAELIPIPNRKDFFRKKTTHWTAASPGYTEF